MGLSENWGTLFWGVLVIRILLFRYYMVLDEFSIRGLGFSV